MPLGYVTRVTRHVLSEIEGTAICREVERAPPFIQGTRPRPGENFHWGLTLFLNVLCLAKSTPEIPSIHCPRLKSEST